MQDSNVLPGWNRIQVPHDEPRKPVCQDVTWSQLKLGAACGRNQRTFGVRLTLLEEVLFLAPTLSLGPKDWDHGASLRRLDKRPRGGRAASKGCFLA
jgi:hypothetical protein